MCHILRFWQEASACQPQQLTGSGPGMPLLGSSNSECLALWRLAGRHAPEVLWQAMTSLPHAQWQTGSKIALGPEWREAEVGWGSSWGTSYSSTGAPVFYCRLLRKPIFPKEVILIAPWGSLFKGTRWGGRGQCSVFGDEKILLEIQSLASPNCSNDETVVL